MTRSRSAAAAAAKDGRRMKEAAQRRKSFKMSTQGENQQSTDREKSRDKNATTTI